MSSKNSRKVVNRPNRSIFRLRYDALLATSWGFYLRIADSEILAVMSRNGLRIAYFKTYSTQQVGSKIN